MRLAAFAVALLIAQGAVAQDAVPGTPFRAYRATDALRRTVVYYLAEASTNNAPLLVFIQGSGCAPHFRRGTEDRITSGYAGVLARVAAGSAHVLAVEKPGVVPFDPIDRRGDAMNCPAAFLEEHTLDRWAVALNAALEAVRTRPDRIIARTVAIGHSEGAAAAVRLARMNPLVTHAALLSPSGMGQFYDFLVWAKRRQASQGQDAIDRAVQAVHAEVARIRSKPDSVVDFAWGHPYRRWPSFLDGTILEDVERAGSGLRVFVSFGTHDASVPVESHLEFVSKISHLVRFITIEQRNTADHSLNTQGQISPGGMADVFVNILNWLRLG